MIASIDLTSVIVVNIKKGLKTGMYYLRSRAAADAIKFTVDTAMLKVKTTNTGLSLYDSVVT